MYALNIKIQKEIYSYSIGSPGTHSVLFSSVILAHLTIGDLKISDAICEGVQKHWDRVRGQRHFPYNFHMGVRKNHLHIFLNFLKKCGNDQLILTFLIKNWVFSDLWTEFHLNQRQTSIETRQSFRSVFKL